MGVGYARDRLRDLLPPGPRREGAARPEAADRDGDQSRAELIQLLKAEAALAKLAGAVAIDKDIGLARQRGQAAGLVGLPEVEEAAPLAMAQVAHVFGHLRQMGRGDHQHVGAMLRQRPPGGRPGQDSGQVEHAHP